MMMVEKGWDLGVVFPCDVYKEAFRPAGRGVARYDC
jgi:hypothetical protein